MTRAKKVKVRINNGLMGLDAAWVDDKNTLVTKRWTEISSTLAKTLVGSKYNGRPKFEFEDGAPEDGEPEDGDPDNGEPERTEDEAPVDVVAE